jgi:Tfp pilus assembly protein PilN
MIEINVLPIPLKNKGTQGVGFLKSIQLPREILIGAGGIFVSGLLIVHLLLLLGFAIQLGRQMIYKRTWQGMLADKKNIDSIGQEMKDLRARITTINEITSKKSIVWSAKLNILSDQLPKGLWLRKIVWDNKLLVVEGSAYSKFHDEINSVGNFVSSLKKEEEFIKNFSSMEVNSVTRTKRGGTEVVDFKVIAKVK